jgi:hypothetical protein
MSHLRAASGIEYSKTGTTADRRGDRKLGMSAMTASYEKCRKPTPPQASSVLPARGGLLQRKCACGGAPGMDGECDACRQKRLNLQRSNASRGGPAMAPPIVHDVLRSPGQPLDPTARSLMESRFGHDFSMVRVHSDTEAALSARAVGAQAYTIGHDVVFGPGQYMPRSRTGLHLLAHELAHVIQQTSGAVAGASPPGAIPISHPSDGFERAANRAADQILTGPSGTSARAHAPLPPLYPQSTVHVARQSEDDGGTSTTDPSSSTSDGGNGGVTGMSSGDDPRKLECGELGCPYKVRDCPGKFCEVIDCGTGPCPTCPPGFGNLVISAWCTYRCYPSGSAIVLISRIGNFPLPTICLD